MRAHHQWDRFNRFTLNTPELDGQIMMRELEPQAVSPLHSGSLELRL
jgi:hypothetical protein